MLMLNNVLANFYERDIYKLIDEVKLFNSDENLWKTQGSVKNSAGNLVLHIIGGLNHFIGATLANSGYVRKRDEEFATKGIERKVFIKQLEELIPMINKALNALSPEDMNENFPIVFDKPGTSVTYVLVQLLAHLNYHLGQVNYLRRILE